MYGRSLSCSLLAALLATTPAHATDDPARVMLVLDVSGSMWGRLEGREKILIAREVVGEILDDWNPATELGVIAYGHRRKGDCADIEAVVPLGVPDPDAVRAVVNELQPKGKTPLTAAVEQAAGLLRHTEERATVVLVSDGRETCERDPCEAGRLLEQSGVDFTAHVIGFDIAAEERAGLECLATTTGGRYFEARAASELQTALSEAVAQAEAPAPAPEPEPEPGPALASIDAPDSVPAGSTLTAGWEGPGNDNDYLTVVSPDTPDNRHGNYTYTREGDPLELRLPDAPGLYEIRYVDNEADRVLARRPIQLTPVSASLTVPETALMGAGIQLQWQGPDYRNDYLTVVTPDTPEGKHGNYTYTREGNPLELLMPDEPGLYEIRYVLGQSKGILARAPIELQAMDTRIDAPEEVAMGAVVEIGWEGPDNRNDYLTVVTPETPDKKHGNYTYTRKGNPLELLMPDEPGLYEIRYVSNQSDQVLARRPVVVTEVAASLTTPEAAPAGGEIQITWEGPDNQNDYLTVVTPETPDNQHGNYTYTREGNPLGLRLPDEPGLHEIRYVSNQSDRILARVPLEITPVSATLRALDVVAAGEPASVSWEGPDNQNDYLTVVTPDTPEGKHGDYTYTRKGSPLDLDMPEEPGLYEIRYVMGQSRTVLTRRPVQVVAADELGEQRAAAGNARVTLTAVGADSGAPLTGEVRWMVYSLDGGDIHRASEPSASFELEPGNYRASLTLEGMSESLDLQLNAGETVNRQVVVPGR